MLADHKNSLNLLTDSEKQDFYNKGYFVRKSYFRATEVEKMTECFDRLQKIAGQFSSTQVYKNTQFVVTEGIIHRIVWACGFAPELKAYSQDERVTEICSALLGSKELVQIICQAHYKLPGDEVSFEWHQDSQNRYYGTEYWQDVNGKGSFVQTLTALDDTPVKSGPLYFIPGSCNQGHLALEQKVNREKYVKESLAAPVELEKGDVVFFNPYVIHGSQANLSKTPRRVFINGFAYPGANSFVYPGCGKGEKISLK